MTIYITPPKDGILYAMYTNRKHSIEEIFKNVHDLILKPVIIDEMLLVDGNYYAKTFTFTIDRHELAKDQRFIKYGINTRYIDGIHAYKLSTYNDMIKEMQLKYGWKTICGYDIADGQCYRSILDDFVSMVLINGNQLCKFRWYKTSNVQYKEKCTFLKVVNGESLRISNIDYKIKQPHIKPLKFTEQPKYKDILQSKTINYTVMFKGIVNRTYNSISMVERTKKGQSVIPPNYGQISPPNSHLLFHFYINYRNIITNGNTYNYISTQYNCVIELEYELDYIYRSIIRECVKSICDGL